MASFAAGLAVGAVVAVVAVYMVGPGSGDAPSEASNQSDAALDTLDFEFWQRLPEAEVTPDTAPYENGAPVRAAPRTRVEYLVQAGAFHRAGAAERRRAELLLAGLPASTSTVGVDDGVLYRVIVGPFESRSETQAAMGQLRDRNIAPVLLERAASAD